MQFKFFCKNGMNFKTIDPVIDYKIIQSDYSEKILVLEFEYKFEYYPLCYFKKILVNGKDLKEYEKEKGKA